MAATAGVITVTAHGDNPAPALAIDISDTVPPAMTTSTPDGVISFKDVNGDPLSMVVDDNPATGTINMDWWPAGYGVIYRTQEHWIEMVFDQPIYAIAFNVAASFDGSGWIKSKYVDLESGATGTTGKTWFDVDTNYSPGFTIASADVCTGISSVIVEPGGWWGVGNLSYTPADNCTSVPEPSPLGLLGAGLLGIGLMARTRNRRSRRVPIDS